MAKQYSQTVSNNSPASGPAKGPCPAQVAAAVAIDVEDNVATAIIGTNDAVKVGGNLIVDANMNDRPNVIASSGIASPRVAAAGTRASSTARRRWHWVVHEHGHLHHRRRRRRGCREKAPVTSEALNDFQFTYGVNLFSRRHAATNAHDHRLGANVATVNPGDIVEVESNHTGNGTVGHWYQYVGAGTLDRTSI